MVEKWPVLDVDYNNQPEQDFVGDYPDWSEYEGGEPQSLFEPESVLNAELAEFNDPPTPNWSKYTDDGGTSFVEIAIVVGCVAGIAACALFVVWMIVSYCNA